MTGVTEGRIVHFFAPGQNGPRAAIIVRAWGDAGGTQGRVNLQVFADGSNDGNGPTDLTFWRTSVPHKSADAGETFWDWPQAAGGAK